MENCDMKHLGISHTVSNVNVNSDAIKTIFNSKNVTTILLKDTGMVIFPHGNGIFPHLETYATYEVEFECSTSRKLPQLSSDSSDTEEDFLRKSAYCLATGHSKWKKKQNDVVQRLEYLFP